MPFVEVNDVELFYTADGDGRPVVHVHGWACDSSDSTWLITELNDVAVCQIAYDQRGCGRSSLGGDYSLATLVSDLAGLIGALDLDRPVVVGHSLGGIVASALAVEHPALVSGIVVLDPPYANVPEAVEAAVGLKAGLYAGDPREVLKAFFEFVQADSTPGWVRTFINRRLEGADVEMIRGMYGVLWDNEYIADAVLARDYLSRRACPVLAVHGMRPFAAAERQLSSHEHSRAVDLTGAGHWVHIERPAEIATLIADWLPGLDPVVVA